MSLRFHLPFRSASILLPVIASVRAAATITMVHTPLHDPHAGFVADKPRRLEDVALVGSGGYIYL